MIDYALVKNWHFDPREQSYDRNTTILYALGLGIGQDPMAANQLRYVYEDGLVALPTMNVTLGFPGLWLRDSRTGIDYGKVVHGEQHGVIFKPLPPEGVVLCTNRVIDVIDKGANKGALIVVERLIHEKNGGDLLSRQTSILMARGDGGFGGPAQGDVPKLGAIPDTPPDAEFEWSTPVGLALTYRLSGDMNPLHADPATAAKAGFARPILHGLASYGIAGFAAIEILCGGQAARLKSIGTRFSAPVFPGETFRFEFWRVGVGEAVFRARVIERDLVVLNGGRIEYQP